MSHVPIQASSFPTSKPPRAFHPDRAAPTSLCTAHPLHCRLTPPCSAGPSPLKACNGGPRHSPMLPPLGCWQQCSGLPCLSFSSVKDQDRTWHGPPHTPSCVTLKICLASLSPGLVCTQSTVGLAQASLGTQLHPTRPTPQPHWSRAGPVPSPALAVRDPTPQMCLLPSCVHAGRQGP